MPSPLRVFSAMSRREKIVLSVLSCTFVVSLLLLLRGFYYDNTEEVPSVGGTFIEGSVGEVKPLNPWFTVGNDVSRDIVSLVFSGLLRYDPESGEIIEDLATMDISENEQNYTLTLKDNVYWHDSTEENPHPVTADDVVFTFQSIQDPEFPNTLLRQNFRGVTIEKLNERTVQFRLEQPYAFFPSNLTLGLIPARYFEGIPVGKFDQVLDFGFQPIGAGPYQLISLIQTDLSTEVTLKRFEMHPHAQYKFERVVLRVFPDYNTLLSDIANLDAVRVVPRNEDGNAILPRGFETIDYSLPQYVALFFNLDRQVMQERALRLGLQLATNKQEIIDALHETDIVDTPLMEIDLSDWRYSYDPFAAQGALVDSNWNLPEKVRLNQLQSLREANETGLLQFRNAVVYLQTGATLSLTGTITDVEGPLTVNGVEVVMDDSEETEEIEDEEEEEEEENEPTTLSGSWTVKLSTESGVSGSLIIGLNRVRMRDNNGAILDTAFVERVASRQEYNRAVEEQRILDRYTKSKNNEIPATEQITIADMYTENGYLRMRKDSDPPSIRLNDASQPLRLTLLTSASPDHYATIANMVKEQWRSIGVDIIIDIPDTNEEFEERMLSRDYDILLFGQSLLDNLDSYPYWHSSQAQDTSGDRSKLKLDAFNLSQYASLEADVLLERIREKRDPASRELALNELRDVLKADVPAVFLYSPRYTYGYRDDVQGVTIGDITLHADKLLSLQDWFIQTDRIFKDGKSWWSFFGWLPTLL